MSSGEPPVLACWRFLLAPLAPIQNLQAALTLACNQDYYAQFSFDHLLSDRRWCGNSINESEALTGFTPLSQSADGLAKSRLSLARSFDRDYRQSRRS